MVPGGPAERSGLVFAGDIIMEVNGTDLSTATHAEAMKALTASPVVKMVLKDPNVAGGAPALATIAEVPSNRNSVSALTPAHVIPAIVQVCGNSCICFLYSWNKLHLPLFLLLLFLILLYFYCYCYCNSNISK